MLWLPLKLTRRQKMKVFLRHKLFENAHLSGVLGNPHVCACESVSQLRFCFYGMEFDYLHSIQRVL